MASRYWVGGTDNWNGTAGTKWATTSGGAGGAAEPTSADDVFFDANSGTVTVTLATTTGICKNLDCTGFTGTLAGSQNLDIYGSLTLGSSMTFSQSGNVNFKATSGTLNINTNGVAFGTGINAVNFTGDGTNGATWEFQNNYTSTKSFVQTVGTINTNGYSITCRSFNTGGTQTRTTNISNSTVTTTNSGWQAVATGLTLTTTGSTIKLNPSGAAFTGGGMTYGIVEIAGAGTHTISGSNTYNQLKYTAGTATTLRFTAGTTHTINPEGWQITGTVGNVVTIDTTSAGSAATISISAGVISCDYMSIKDSTASGGATFYAGNNSTSVSGNSGWIFTAPPSFSGGTSLMLGV